LGNYSVIDPDAKVKGFDNGGKTVKEMFYKYSSNKTLLIKQAEKIQVKYAEKAKLHTGEIKNFVANFNDYWTTREAFIKECEGIHQNFLNTWSAIASETVRNPKITRCLSNTPPQTTSITCNIPVYSEV